MEGRERPAYKGREVKGGRGGEVREGEGRRREMEGPTYKGREGRGEREGGSPRLLLFPPGPRGARIVTGRKRVATTSRRPPQTCDGSFTPTTYP